MSPAEVLCALQRTAQGTADSAQHGSPPFFFVSPLLKVGKTVQLWMPRFPVLRPKSKIDDFPIGEHDRGFRMSYSTPSGAQPIFRSIRGQVCVSHFWPISVILGEGLSPLPDLIHFDAGSRLSCMKTLRMFFPVSCFGYILISSSSGLRGPSMIFEENSHEREVSSLIYCSHSSRPWADWGT